MKRAISKLNSRQGVTMILALIFLLIAVMVTGVVLNVVTSSSLSVITSVQEQQDKLLLRSALRIVSAEIEEQKGVITITPQRKWSGEYDHAYKKYEDGIYDGYSLKDVNMKQSFVNADGKEVKLAFCDLLSKMFEAYMVKTAEKNRENQKNIESEKNRFVLYAADTQVFGTQQVRITFPNDGANRLKQKTVKVTLKMEKMRDVPFHLFVTLSIDGEKNSITREFEALQRSDNAAVETIAKDKDLLVLIEGWKLVETDDTFENMESNEGEAA